MNGNSREIHRMRKQHLASIGFNHSTEDVQTWTNKWNNLRNNAQQEGHVCVLSFEEYVNKALEAGFDDPNMIGNGRGFYQMGRFGDIGDYTIDNCRFITQEQNIYERRINGGDSRIGFASRNKSGRSKDSHSYIARHSDILKGRTKETHPGVRSTSIKNSKSFRLVDSSGTVYIGINLSEFCESHNLSYQALGRLCRCETSEHKGWTGSYIVDNDLEIE